MFNPIATLWPAANLGPMLVLLVVSMCLLTVAMESLFLWVMLVFGAIKSEHTAEVFWHHAEPLASAKGSVASLL